MTKITGYRFRMTPEGGYKPNFPGDSALGMHLEMNHGFVTAASIATARRRVIDLATPSGVSTSDKSIDEVLHEIEHSEHHTHPDYDEDEAERMYQVWIEAGRPTDDTGEYMYFTPHHHVGDVVVIDMELDLDDDMIEDQP